MPSGTCDPASLGAAYNSGNQAVDDGAVMLEWRYGWDGTSVRPDCVGPLLQVTATNRSASIYYAHFETRKGWKRIVIDPNVTVTYTQGQLRSAGFTDNTDIEGLYITTNPTHP